MIIRVDNVLLFNLYLYMFEHFFNANINERKMYAHADLELQWLLLLFGETRVISVLGS